MNSHLFETGEHRGQVEVPIESKDKNLFPYKRSKNWIALIFWETPKDTRQWLHNSYGKMISKLEFYASTINTDI